MPIPIILLIALAMMIAIALTISSHRTTLANWAEAAAQLGLDLTGGGTFSFPRLDGLIDHYGVSVHRFTKGSGNNQQVFTRFTVGYPTADFRFELSRQTKAGGFLRRMVGRQDVEIGDASFDDAFVIKTVDPDRLSAFLTGQRRSTLGRLLATYPTLEVTNDSVRVDVRRVIRDPEVIVSTARRLVGVGRSLSGHNPDIDEAMTARESGDLGEALRRMRAAIEASPDDVERRLQEIDTLAAAGNTADLEARVEELEWLAPADPEVRGWKQSVAAPAAPTPELTEEPSIDADAATQDLFGGRQLSFAVRDKFIARYAEGRVHWSGTVKSARAYDSDHDFGRGPGVKAIVTVAALAHDLFGTTEVDAIVELPESSQVPARGDIIAFDGTLTAVDPLMRNFTVRRATLT